MYETTLELPKMDPVEAENLTTIDSTRHDQSAGNLSQYAGTVGH